MKDNIAIREFEPTVIVDDDLEQILEAARLTQSAKNLQPWYFIVIKDRATLDKIAELMNGDMDEGFTKSSPMAVAIVGDPKSEFWLYDLGRVTQTMTLVAWELGVGSCVISGPEPPDREAYRTLAGRVIGVPENLKFQELIAFVYPRGAKKKEKKNWKKITKKNRKDYDEIVFRERFGSK